MRSISSLPVLGGALLCALLCACGGGGGDVPAARTLQAAGAGVPAALQARDGVQVDPARGERYELRGRQVVVLRATAGADAPPVRSFPLPDVLRAARVLRLDGANDVLYAGGDAAGGGSVVAAWSLLDTAAGMAAVPARAMFVEGRLSSFVVDPLRHRLYVADAGGTVRAYAGADTASGPLVASTTYPLLGSGVAIDAARDRLYVADLFAGLLIVDRASLPGAAVGATLSIDGARRVALDTVRDCVLVSTGDRAYVFQHASALSSASLVPVPLADASPWP